VHGSHWHHKYDSDNGAPHYPGDDSDGESPALHFPYARDYGVHGDADDLVHVNDHVGGYENDRAHANEHDDECEDGCGHLQCELRLLRSRM
jgi:hypothetical protein